jgi:hypothetical protein
LNRFISESTSKHPQLRYTPAASPGEESEEDWNDLVEDWIARKVTKFKLDDTNDQLLQELNKLSITSPSPRPNKVRTVIREATNVLNVQKGELPRKVWDRESLEFKHSIVNCIFTSTVDRTLKVYSYPNRQTSSKNPLELLETISFGSPVLSFVQHPLERYKRFLACGLMTGGLTLVDLITREKLVELKDHNKYVVKVVWSPDGKHLATLGYDKLIHLYSVTIQEDSLEVSLSLEHTLHPRTNPEAAIFLPSSSHLVWTARDDHLLHYLSTSSSSSFESIEYNLNPNQDSFTSFSILSINLHPILPLLSLQTNTENPRIFLYPFHSQVRLKTIHTMTQQSDYFNPRHSWVPCSSGSGELVVNSEDGIVRVCHIQREGEVLKKGCHGIAAPLKDDEDDEEEGGGEVNLTEELKSERAKARRDRDRGSSVVRDVEVVELLDDDGGYVILSAGFDKTVRMII